VREAGIEWRVATALVPYPEALSQMEERVAAVLAGDAPELVWLLEHPPLYTAGTSAADHELLGGYPFPVYKVGRGGRYTYHGPGQRVVYLVLDLKRRKPDLRQFVWQLEAWIIGALARLDVEAGRRQGRIGVWVTLESGAEAKIAAVGVRIRRWVTCHGISINVAPDLAHFAGIVPCGISDYGVTSVAALGRPAGMAALDAALAAEFPPLFAPQPAITEAA
jgi:lipoyl(octanoyl) transferase